VAYALELFTGVVVDQEGRGIIIDLLNRYSVTAGVGHRLVDPVYKWPLECDYWGCIVIAYSVFSSYGVRSMGSLSRRTLCTLTLLFTRPLS
jgi:hypothetical protein